MGYTASSRGQSLRRLVLIAIVVGLTGCGGDAAPSGPDQPNPKAVATVAVTPPSTTLSLGDSVVLTATPKDSQGTPVPGRAITWSSASPSVATVSSAGRVKALAAGVAAITATADGVPGTASITVTGPMNGLAITAIAPSPLVEGQPATITGRGFSAVAANNQVKIDGELASVTAATATELQIIVPAMGCKPARTVDVQVRFFASQSNVVRQPIASGSVVEMNVGDEFLWRDPPTFCFLFDESATAESYLIGVQSVSEDVTVVTPATVAAVSAGPNGLDLPPSAAEPFVPSRRFVEPRLGRDPLVDFARAEAALRNSDRALRSRRSSLRARAGAGARQSPSDSRGHAVGNALQLKVPEFNDQCNNYRTVTAVVRVVGAHGIWLEDIDNPPTGYSAAQLQVLSDFFDASVHPVETEYFGAPSDLDGNGRTTILVTGQVNQMSAAYDPLFALGGMVKAANYFATTSCPSSNEGEIIYLRAPDPAGAIGPATETAAAEIRTMELLLAHEFVHVVQFARTILGNPPAGVSQPDWLLEGQATLGEEVVGNAVTGRRTGQNYGYSVAFNTQGADYVDWYRAWSAVGYYFGYASSTSRVANAPEQCSWLGLSSRGNDGPCLSNDLVSYHVSWSLLRWLSDRYAGKVPGGELALQRALVASPAAGLGALSDAVGVPADIILAQWAAALYTDDRYPGMAPGLTLPSWNVFDIQNRDNPNARLVPRDRGFANFADQVLVRAGSSAYFRVAGAGRPATAVRVRSPSGGELPRWMRVWIARLK